MSVREYVGARYVPIVMGEWDNSKTYEPLMVVTYQGDSYTSRQYVPAGIEITNESYWVHSADYNAQVEQYRRETAAAKAAADAAQLDIDTLLPKSAFDTTNTVDAAITNAQTESQLYVDMRIGFVTPEMYGAKGDGKTDDTAAIQAAIDSGKSVMLQDKTYLVTDTLQINKNSFALAGTSRKSRLYQNANKDILHLSGNNITIAHVTLESTSSGTQRALVLDGCYYLHAYDFSINLCACGVYISAGELPTNNANNYFSNFEITNYSDDGIYIEGSVDAYFSSFMLHAYQNDNANGIHLKNKVESAIFLNGEVFRGAHGLMIESENYDSTHAARNVPAFSRFTNVYFDTTIDSCELTACRQFVFDGCWFSCGWSGNLAKPTVHLYRAWNITFIGCSFLGGAGGVYDDASVTDIKFNSCTFFGTNMKKASSGDVCDIHLNAAQRVLIENCSFSDNVYPTENAADYGVRIENGAHFIKIHGSLFEGHKVAGVWFDVQSTAQLEILQCIGVSDYSVNPLCTLFTNSASISYRPKVPASAAATIGNVQSTIVVINAALNLLAIVALNYSNNSVTVNKISGTVNITGSYDPDTNTLTLTPDSTLWNQTKIWE